MAGNRQILPLNSSRRLAVPCLRMSATNGAIYSPWPRSAILRAFPFAKGLSMRSCQPVGLSVLMIMFLGAARADDFDIKAFFANAASAGRAGVAEKTKVVDARPAAPGEVVVTIIRSEGVETKSKPADPGDMVVRNRCEQTGNEQYLVKAASFARRYGAPIAEVDQEGWRSYQPVGVPTRFVVLKPNEGPFSFKAPWGEMQVARPGDVIAQDPNNADDTYRIAAAAFSCTYAIVKAPSA
jgi:hypothetical protein